MLMNAVETRFIVKHEMGEKCFGEKCPPPQSLKNISLHFNCFSYGLDMRSKSFSGDLLYNRENK